jgi:molybdate transport system substrate-binding protein
MRSLLIAGAALAAATVVAVPTVCAAAEIGVLCALGAKEAVEEITLQFQRASGHKIVIAFANLGNIMKRIEGGGRVDLVILPQQGIARLVKDGRAAEGTVVARGGTGVAIRKGASKPDISSPDAFRRTLLTAKSITYLDPAGGGVSGVHVAKVLDRLGIAAEVKQKTVLHRNSDEAAALIAQGKADIGINLIQELLPKPGIDVVGPLPGELQLSIPYAAAIMNGAASPAQAQALLEFMRRPEAAAVIKAKGMEPG